MNIFSNFVSAKPKSLILGVGNHVANLIRIFLTDSFTNSDGSAKAESDWSAPTQQLAVQVGNEHGSLTTRLNGVGYIHTDDMDPDEMIAQGLVDVDGYVAKELENGKFERLPSETNTEACTNILNRFFHACAVPEGTTLEELMVLAKDNEIKLAIVVEEREYDGKFHNEIKSFKQATADVPEEEELA